MDILLVTIFVSLIAGILFECRTIFSLKLQKEHLRWLGY